MKHSNNVFISLKPALQQALKEISFYQPTPVQSRVIPVLIQKQNAWVQSETGSGKTHAYLLPIFNSIDCQQDYVQAVVTAPSRELAQQLYQVAEQLKKASKLPIAIAHLAGGSDRLRQIKRIEQKRPQLVIATPGRLSDLVEKKILPLASCRYFIIDEADMTLDMGFLQEVDQGLHHCSSDTTIAAFSATLPVKLTNFLRKYMQQPQEIVLETPTVIAPTIKNDLLDIGSKSRKKVLYQLLTMGQPYLALVFANTKDKVDELTRYLQDRGLKTAKIHGGIPERERKRVLRQIEEGKFQYVVASDLAARGIDIAGVSLVINYEIPRGLEFMVHRIGRTGRNGLSGHAITLIREEDMPRVTALEKMGLHFDFVEIKAGELVARKHYHARSERTASNQSLDTRLKGYVKKAKRKRKPGYRKKIKRAIAQDRAQKRRTQQRHERRHAQRLRRRMRQQEKN